MKKGLLTLFFTILLLPVVCSAQTLFEMQNQMLDNVELLVRYKAGEIPSTEDDMDMVFDAIQVQGKEIVAKISHLQFDDMTKIQAQYIKNKSRYLYKTVKAYKAENRFVLQGQNECDRLATVIQSLTLGGIVGFGSVTIFQILTGSPDLAVAWIQGFFSYSTIILALMVLQVACFVLIG